LIKLCIDLAENLLRRAIQYFGVSANIVYKPPIRLKVGGVFDDDLIDAYFELKMEAVTRFSMSTHPVEFDMYYSIYKRSCRPAVPGKPVRPAGSGVYTAGIEMESDDETDY